MRIFLYGLLALTAFFACQNTPKIDPNTEIIKADRVNKVDTINYTPKSSFDAATYVLKSGKLFWAGKKVMSYPHSGYAYIKSATMLVKDGEIVRGDAVIDMTSIVVDNSVDTTDNPKLQKHLHSADFFDTKKYPTATVKLEGILPARDERYRFIGECLLKVKEKENNINIPFDLKVNGNELYVKSVPFVFSRRFWDINFNNANMGIARDLVIDDKVPIYFEMTLIPKPQ